MDIDRWWTDTVIFIYPVKLERGFNGGQKNYLKMYLKSYNTAS